jgi:hypothetical protein
MKILLTTALAILSLISVAQPSINNSPDSTYIYIYRTGQFNGSLANWTIFVDGQKTCKLSNNRFIRVPVQPGKHTISAKMSGASVLKKETEVEIEAEKGNNYFVACSIKSSITRARLEMIEVTKSTGTKQMEHMTLDNCQEGADQ